MKMKKSLRLLSLLLGILFLISGCGSSSPGPGTGENPDPADPALSEGGAPAVLGARTLEDGRKTGGTAKGGIGDELRNVFFSFRVDKAELAGAFGEELPDRGFVYLVAEITVNNLLDDAVPMWASDFLVQWGEGDNDYAYPLAKFAESQMDDEFRLAAGESVTKHLVFEVPVPEAENEYNISYLEYYEDEVEGNRFYVIFPLSAPADGLG